MRYRSYGMLVGCWGGSMLLMSIECKSKNKALVTNIYKGDMKTLDRKRLKYPNPNSLAELMVNITCPMVFKK